MEHHDDWTKGDDELDNETRTWTGITEFSNRNEDQNASEEVQEAIPDDPEQLRETQPARGLPVPRQPSQHEREEHELTHLPFRAWCKTCVAAKARQAYHTKQPDRRDCLQLDFGFLTEGNRQDAVLVVTDPRTGCCADTNGRRRSNESLSESSITTNWNPDVHESRIFEWKPWSHRAIHTDTLGTTSNLTNTDGRQIFEVADPNDSSC